MVGEGSSVMRMSRRAFVATSAAVAAGAAGVNAAPAAAHARRADDDVVAFFLISDTHFLADKENPSRLDESSAGNTGRLVDTLNQLAGTEIPARSGAGVVRKPSFVIHGGDVIDIRSVGSMRTWLLGA